MDLLKSDTKISAWPRIALSWLAQLNQIWNGSSDTLVKERTEVRSKETQNSGNKTEINYNLGVTEKENEYFVSFFSEDNTVAKNSKKGLKGMKTEQWKFPQVRYQLNIPTLLWLNGEGWTVLLSGHWKHSQMQMLIRMEHICRDLHVSVQSRGNSLQLKNNKVILCFHKMEKRWSNKMQA